MMTFVWILYIFIIGAHATANRNFRSSTTVKTYENGTVLLPCHVEDQGGQTRVKWWREGVLLADSFEQQKQPPAERITLYSNGSLRLLHAQREDSGHYVCQVIRPSPWGHVTQVHEIEVMYPPSVKTVPESGELEVNLGDRVEMQCVTKGVPAPVISWRTKDGEIPLLDARPQLRFHADHQNLTGRYTCVADNGIGDPAEGHIDLRIRYKPEIHVDKPWMHAYIGMRVSLQCKVIAWPMPEVEWYFHNDSIKALQIIDFSHIDSLFMHHLNKDNLISRLRIMNVKEEYYGTYICRASNALGTTEEIIELSPIANPAVFKKESRSTSNTSYNFIWEVDSYSPIIDYQFWFRKYRRGVGGEWHKVYIPGDDGVTGSPVHARSFNLTGLDVATHYEAVVLSRNRYGWSRPSEILRFHTEGAPVDSSENIETDGDQEKNKITVVQLSSISQHYLLASDANRSAYNRAQALSLILSMLCISVLTYNSRF
ncbi:hypothetical protein P5V15_002134 [Pogonomyrmex californicus]